MDRKVSARMEAALCPTCRTPNPKSNRANPAFLLFSIASIRFCADFSASRSRSATSSCFRVYKSEKFLTRSDSTSCSITAGPIWSISMALREAKCLRRSFSCAGQVALTQRQAASPSDLKIFVWHSGQTDGILNGAFRFAAGSITRTTLGMISPAFSITT